VSLLPGSRKKLRRGMAHILISARVGTAENASLPIVTDGITLSDASGAVCVALSSMKFVKVAGDIHHTTIGGPFTHWVLGFVVNGVEVATANFDVSTNTAGLPNITATAWSSPVMLNRGDYYEFTLVKASGDDNIDNATFRAVLEAEFL